MNQRDKNREEMPNVAEIVDLFTKHFGVVKVLACEDFETGKKAGKVEDKK